MMHRMIGEATGLRPLLVDRRARQDDPQVGHPGVGLERLIPLQDIQADTLEGRILFLAKDAAGREQAHERGQHDDGSGARADR